MFKTFFMFRITKLIVLVVVIKITEQVGKTLHSGKPASNAMHQTKRPVIQSVYKKF